MATPHIEADVSQIAKTVLMPGDPLRARFIAETYLTDVIQVNAVRGMLGYTGYYQGKRVSVMGSGMGMPSIGIYSYELYKFYNVENIIRIGSCGTYTEKLGIYDCLLVDKSFSESSYAKVMGIGDEKYLYPSTELNKRIQSAAEDLAIPLVSCCVRSSDVFYSQSSIAYQEYFQQYNCWAVEMESFALFANAKALNKKAACILTVSDSFVTNESTSSKERQTAFTKMMEIALLTIKKLD